MGFLFHCIVQDLSLVKVDSHLLNFGSNLALSSINLSQFTIEILNSRLSFGEPSLQFHLGHLQFLCFGNCLRLILSSPHSSFTLSLGCLSVDIFTSSEFFIQCLLHSIKLMFYILELTQNKLPLFSFIVSNMFGIIKCSLQGLFHLLNHVDIVGNVSSKSPLLGFKISKSHVSLFNLLANISELSNQILVGLLSRRLCSCNFISSSSAISGFSHNFTLVLFNL